MGRNIYWQKKRQIVIDRHICWTMNIWIWYPGVVHNHMVESTVPEPLDEAAQENEHIRTHVRAPIGACACPHMRVSAYVYMRVCMHIVIQPLQRVQKHTTWHIQWGTYSHVQRHATWHIQPYNVTQTTWNMQPETCPPYGSGRKTFVLISQY